MDGGAAMRQCNIVQFVNHYEAVIGWIVLHCGGSDKFAHTYTGLSLWLVAALVLRRLGKPFELGLVVIIVLEIGNECIDRVSHGSWMWRDTLGDAAATWFWPTVLTVTLRWVPSLSHNARSPFLRCSSDGPDSAAAPSNRKV